MSEILSNFVEINEGVRCIWNNDFVGAEKIFEPKKNVDCRYALHWAEVIFIRSFITGDVSEQLQSASRLKEAKQLTQQQIKLFESKLKSTTGSPSTNERDLLSKNPEIANLLLNARIVYGDLLYMTAVLQMVQNEKIKGAFNLRKSWKVFEKVLKLSKSVPNLDEELKRSLQFGAGFFLFAISILPKNRVKLVELVGFKADREKGLAFIREAHNSGGFRAPFATMLLLFNNLLLPRGLADPKQYLQEADSLIKDSIQKYPNGTLFYVMGSHCARKQCDVDQGIKYMNSALENCKGLGKEPFIYKYELGNCYCMKLEWSKGADQFRPLVDEQNFQFRIVCAIQLGCCYIMMDEYEKAMEIFRKLQSFSTKKRSQFEIIARQAQRYLQNGGHFAAFELLYLRRDLVKMLPLMSDLLKQLEEKAKKTKALSNMDTQSSEKKSSSNRLSKFGGKLSPFSKKKEGLDSTFDDKASYLLLKGSMYKAIQKDEEGMECFRQVIQLEEFVQEKLYIPYAYYELGESYYLKGQLTEAEEMMKKCGKYSGYDWEDPLKVRLRLTMDQLKHGTIPSKDVPVSLDNLEINVDDGESASEIEDDDDE